MRCQREDSALEYLVQLWSHSSGTYLQSFPLKHRYFGEGGAAGGEAHKLRSDVHFVG